MLQGQHDIYPANALQYSSNGQSLVCSGWRYYIGWNQGGHRAIILQCFSPIQPPTHDNDDLQQSTFKRQRHKIITDARNVEIARCATYRVCYQGHGYICLCARQTIIKHHYSNDGLSVCLCVCLCVCMFQQNCQNGKAYHKLSPNCMGCMVSFRPTNACFREKCGKLSIHNSLSGNSGGTAMGLPCSWNSRRLVQQPSDDSR